MTVTLLRRSDALQAVTVLIIKSLLFFIALITLSMIVSIFASRRLTVAIRALYEATGRVSSGDFNIRVDTKSNGEIESLGDNMKATSVTSYARYETGDVMPGIDKFTELIQAIDPKI